VTKTLDELDRSACSTPGPTLDYLASLEWIAAKENVCLAGPARARATSWSPSAPPQSRPGTRSGTSPPLTWPSPLPGLADNSVGRVIENLLRNDLILVDEVGFAPLDDTGAQLLFQFVSAAYERRALGVASHWPFDQRGRFLPELRGVPLQLQIKTTDSPKRVWRHPFSAFEVA